MNCVVNRVGKHWPKQLYCKKKKKGQYNWQDAFLKVFFLHKIPSKTLRNSAMD